MGEQTPRDGETGSLDLDATEALLNECWGRSVFGWTVVRSGNPPYWHGFCGDGPTRSGEWAHHVEQPTLSEVLAEMVALSGRSTSDG